MVKEKYKENVKKKNNNEQKDRSRIFVFLYHLLSFIFRTPFHKKRFVLMIGLKDL